MLEFPILAVHAPALRVDFVIAAAVLFLFFAAYGLLLFAGAVTLSQSPLGKTSGAPSGSCDARFLHHWIVVSLGLLASLAVVAASLW